MKTWKYLFLSIVALHSFTSFGQLPLTQMVYSAEPILQARFLSAEGDSIVFLSKDLHANSGFDDTIIVLQSEAFPTWASREDLKDAINKQIISGLKESKELLFFVHHTEGNVVYPFYSGIRIWINDEVRFTSGPMGLEDADFVSFMEKISWDEMLQRVSGIEARLKPVYALREIKNPSKRNKALFQWLDDHKREFNLGCDFNADCGWGGFQDIVLRWIIDGNIMADTWKAGEVFQRMYPNENGSLKGFLATFMDPSAAFTSEDGLHFLLEKALSNDQTIVERQRALTFMVGALSFILQDTFQDDPYFKKYTQGDRQQEMLDQLMPLMYDDDVAPYAFINIFRLSHSEIPGEADRQNLSKLPELMQLYKTQTPENTPYRGRFTDFLLASCTEEQWKSLSGNDAMIYVFIYDAYNNAAKNQFYNAAKNQLKFGISYNYREGLIVEKPKVRLEKWVDGMMVADVTKEFYNEDGSPYKPAITYLKQWVDVSDLDSGEWTFYLFGVAGDYGEYRWTSERGTFTK